jgi:hypothetical protein
VLLAALTAPVAQRRDGQRNHEQYHRSHIGDLGEPVAGVGEVGHAMSDLAEAAFARLMAELDEERSG